MQAVLRAVGIFPGVELHELGRGSLVSQKPCHDLHRAPDVAEEPLLARAEVVQSGFAY